jgi:hypothetical protein
VRNSHTRAIGFLLDGTTESRHPAVLGSRQATDGEDALGCGRRIVRRIDVRRAHVELAQPNRRVIGIEDHAAIVQEAHGKAKPAGECAVWAGGWGTRRGRLRG